MVEVHGHVVGEAFREPFSRLRVVEVDPFGAVAGGDPIAVEGVDESGVGRPGEEEEADDEEGERGTGGHGRMSSGVR